MRGKVLAISMCVMALMGGCGGGGASDGAPPPSLTTAASVSYPETFFDDPWDTVRMEPNVIGSIDRSLLTFEASSLPSGFSIDPRTGIVSGGFTSSGNGSGFAGVTVTSSAHTGSLSTELRVYPAGLGYVGSSSTGFTSTGGNSAGDWTFDGAVGVLGELSFELTMSINQRDSSGQLVNPVGLPLPSDAVVVYSLDPNSPQGATIDPRTGLIRWTPSSSGTFRITQHAGATKNGITFRQTVNFEIRV